MVRFGGLVICLSPFCDCYITYVRSFLFAFTWDGVGCGEWIPLQYYLFVVHVFHGCGFVLSLLILILYEIEYCLGTCILCFCSFFKIFLSPPLSDIVDIVFFVLVGFCVY